jgi:hypothetical protein
MEEIRSHFDKRIDLIAKAWLDKNLYEALIKDPKGTFEKEIGVSLPKSTKVIVHIETPKEIHIVLPLKPVSSRRDKIKAESYEYSSKIARDAFLKAVRTRVPGGMDYEKGEMEG